MSKWITTAGALIFALSTSGVIAATGEPATAEPMNTQPSKGPSTKAEVEKARENRKKPLQRCDQLADKAQQDCLQKAREHVLEARKQREAGEKGAGERGRPAATKDAARAAPAK